MFTLVTPTLAFASENAETGGDKLMAKFEEQTIEIDNEELEQQVENNLIYSEISEVCSENSAISFDYAGGYINENNELVICAAGDEFTTEEIAESIEDICSMDTSDVIIEKVKYSYEELEDAREYFETNLDRYIIQAEVEGNTELYDILSSITSNSIDDEFNKLVVYVPLLDNEKLEMLNDLFDCKDIIMFENESNEASSNEIKETVRPGRCIFGLGNDGWTYRFSIGFRAWYQTGGQYYYGFCTAGHSTVDLQAPKVIYSDASRKNAIGKVLTDKWSGNVDAAFVQLYGGNTISNTYSNFSFVSNKYMTSLAKNTKVYMVGSMSGCVEGKISSSDCSEKISDVKLSHLYKAKISAVDGDSGGLLYTYYNPDGAGGYIVAGVLSGGNDVYNYFSTCKYIVSDLKVYPY